MTAIRFDISAALINKRYKGTLVHSIATSFFFLKLPQNVLTAVQIKFKTAFSIIYQQVVADDLAEA